MRWRSQPTAGNRGRRHPPAARAGSPLTRREQEIAQLVADDLSNRQIAATLFLSERTVETHVTNILNKLGLNSRAQITRWLTAPGPVTAERLAGIGVEVDHALMGEPGLL